MLVVMMEVCLDSIDSMYEDLMSVGMCCRYDQYHSDQNALSHLRFECKRETMAENNMVLKYLQKVSLDKYLMIVEIEF